MLCWLAATSCTSLQQPQPGAAHRPAKEDTYTITSVLQLLPPFDLAAMNDEFQEVRVVTQDHDSCTVELTCFPLYQPVVGENPNWRKDDARMSQYLKPTPTENWDEAMRRDLITELRYAGIDPEDLTDKQLVEAVSKWAMKRAHSTKAFAVWAICYPQGKPAVYPPLRAAFDHEKPDPSWTDRQMFEQEALGRSMFYTKTHGSCTSYSVYLATILRALGIPTRIVFCIPPFDPNDKAQADLFYANVHHHQVRETVRAALDGLHGFANHLFLEVYVGRRWVRLNYSRLGQPVLDAHYFGLLTHIYSCPSLSQAPLARTWGVRYFNYPADQPRLSSQNPYRLISVQDHFGARAQIPNPPWTNPPATTAASSAPGTNAHATAAEWRTATIIGLYLPNSPQVPQFVTDFLTSRHSDTDFLIACKEWLPGVSKQMNTFASHAGNDFILRAPPHPDLRARLDGSSFSSGDGAFQAFGARLCPEDKARLLPGVAYTIQPTNTSETFRWVVAPGVTLLKPAK